MAHESVDRVSSVDVISDAENIKQLLKMPFNPKVCGGGGGAGGAEWGSGEG